MPRNLETNILTNNGLEDLPDNKEDIQLIWLDKQIGTSPDTRMTEKMLKLLNANTRFYKNENECLQMIENLQGQDILLVVSRIFAHSILPRIHELRAIRGIFIFCEASNLYRCLLGDYSPKIVDIYNDRDSLLKSISKTMRLIEKQNIVFHLFDRKQNSTRDLSRNFTTFLWHSLLIRVLRKMAVDEKEKNDMLDHCTAYYRHNKEEIKKINQFRISYTSDQAIKYYTNNSFLYKLLNRALRTEDVKLLYIFRFFIVDLCSELGKEKEKLTGNEPITLFRGQQMSKEEFENLKINIGSLIAVNGFF
ncbi:unnamed protein product [Rotaria magnacalcarata]|uniref:Uncharacterized protein n=1 Tax=Rotaria magnacalcarata TaxID=392030 RepID=A0A816B9U8_9BILA|nr:unnamed protein product [Rotaria magnacalcarata]CAF1653345.1 unnamed protein product [Rotaria magnacalcarata]CAF4043889.1 unnamed protein product [Rotaria magnacalcarata]